jgi:hypothetical protein
MAKISDDEARSKYGISTKHEKMNNGELRFRLLCEDGSAYIRTVAGDQGAWQNSHHHKSVKETYIVQEGWMAYAEMREGVFIGTVYGKDASVTTQPGIVHNVYLPQGAVIHTVKHGIALDRDWHVSEEFDEMTKSLSEVDIKQWEMIKS